MLLRTSIFLVAVLVTLAVAVQKGDEFFTKPIRAKFDDDNVVWTTHANARQKGMQNIFSIFCTKFS